MNKKLLLVLSIIALGLLVYNVTLVDFDHPFVGDSIVACIGIMTSLCAIVLLLIYATSKKIARRLKDR
ncbi:MAG: hypothetical protein AAGF77_00195 [Bacteroidota bacterium]